MPPIVLLGPPASGKGTQGRLLSERAGLEYFSTGRQLRAELEADSEVGQAAASFLAGGKFVPDALALELALGWVGERRSASWVLDGFPRTIVQAHALDDFLGADRTSLRAVLIEAPEEELEARVAERRECVDCPWVGTRAEAEKSGSCPRCGSAIRVRADDELENFRARLDAHRTLVLPTADYYAATDRLCRVDGCGLPEDVFGRLVEQLELS